MGKMLSPEQAFMSEDFLKDLEEAKKEGSAQIKINKFLRDYVTNGFTSGHTTFTKKFITDKAKQGYTWTTNDGEVVKPSSDNLKKAMDNINSDQTFPYRIDENGKGGINGYIIVDKEAEQKEQEAIEKEKERKKEEAEKKKREAEKKKAEEAKKAATNSTNKQGNK